MAYKTETFVIDGKMQISISIYRSNGINVECKQMLERIGWIAISNGAMSRFFSFSLSPFWSTFFNESTNAQRNDIRITPTCSIAQHVLCAHNTMHRTVATGKFLSSEKNPLVFMFQPDFQRNMHIRSWQVLSFTLISVRYLLHHSNQMTAFFSFYLRLSFELYFQPLLKPFNR